ncbi:collagen binding domain-containing protein [Lysinibacillus sp. KU-BSD001]|uniref:collagen binding domain-containing protein n=1 Tax=Lysinibacillus sp. KU-BSD001 TaxID=3141328 RepID=UPI0036EDB690
MRKLNIAVLAVLLVFQTILSPISVFANEIETGTPPAASSTSGTSDPNVSSSTTSEDSATVVPYVTPMTTSEDSAIVVINAPLTDFTMTINGEPIKTYDKPLEQNEKAKMTFSFNANLDYGPKVGDYFEFQLPTNFLIDFSDAFHGGKPKSAIAPGFSYEADAGKVRVTLTDVDLLNHTGSSVPISFDFTSGFNLSGRNEDLTQDFEVPNATGGTEIVSVTFKPGTANEKMKKTATSKGVYTGDGTNGTVLGERYIDWEVWVNEAGKNLTSATVKDTPTGGHSLDGDIKVESYSVGLTKVADTPFAINDYPNFAAITLSGNAAYKITYRTKITLKSEERDGQKSFSNTIALTDTDTTNNETITSGTVTTTYGKALDKSKLSGTNYKSKWEVRYNYNQLNIATGDAWIEDTLPGSHVIDQSSIVVQKVSVKEDGTFDSVIATLNSSDYSVSDVTEGGKVVGFKLQFNDAITDAYRITYDAEYKKDNGQKFFADASNDSETIKNTVTSGTVSSGKTAGHTLTEGILKKERTSVDFDKKEILWTVTITNDHPTEPITGLTLTDTFATGSKTGVHTLVDTNKDSHVDTNDIGVSKSTGNKQLDSNGFTIGNMEIDPNSSVTVTYKTSYAISDDGSVINSGYGNTAVATWTDPVATSKTYTLTKTADYTPAPATANNGRKTGSYNYATQEFTWLVQVNTNKRNIQGAVLVDTLGAGHEIIAGTLGVYKTTLGSGDTSTSKGEQLTEVTDYTVSYTEELIENEVRKTGYTLTFDNALASDKNNEVYLVEYKTKDMDNIVGIGSDEPKYDSDDTYKNSATFKTTTTHTLESTPVTVKNANSLINKAVSNNTSSNSTDILLWTIDVNKSLSDLKNVVVKDNPSDSLMLIQSSIEIRKYGVGTSGATTSASWGKLSNSSFVHSFENGGFTIDFGNLAKEGYQVRYQTIALGAKGQEFKNNAVITFDDSNNVAGNQQTDKPVVDKLNFSTSNASIDMTKGNLKFYKVGLDPTTADKKSLSDVEFQLIKTIKGTDYIIATQKSDADGFVVFNNINYGSYKIKEVKAPVGYKLMGEQTVMLDENTDTLKVPTYVTELVNEKTVDSSNACPNFTLTIKDINGKPIVNKTITLQDSNSNVKFTDTTDNGGKITIPRTGTKAVQAGSYQVYEGSNHLGNVTVKYGIGECQGELQPQNTCPAFTVTLNDKDGNPRPNVEVVLKDKSGNVITAPSTKTDAGGKFTVPPTTSAGKYDLYEGNQYLGEVTVDYSNNNCETAITEAPTCPNFTLTLKDADGKVRENVIVIIKDKDTGNTITQTINPTNNEGKIKISNLEPGTYEVYEGAEKLGEFVVKTTCEATIQPAPACEFFTITVKDEDGILPESTKVILTNKTTNETIEATVDTEGKVALPSATTPAGEYEVEVTDSGKVLGDVTVTYTKTPCEAEVEKPRACDIFTITVNGQDGNPKTNTKVIVEDSNGTEVVLTTDETDADGKIQLPQNQKPGAYTVYEQNADGTKGDKIGDVAVTYTSNCQGVVIKNACPVYTLTVNNKDLQPVGAGVQVTIKDQAGQVITTGTTDVNGQIMFNDKSLLQQGITYEVYNSANQKLDDITVSYIDEICGAAVKVSDNACPIFTLTLLDANNTAREGIIVTIKDDMGTAIATGITDVNGQLTVPYTLEKGTYQLYEGSTFVSNLTVENCEAIHKLTLPTNPGGGTDPGTPPTNPGGGTDPGTPPTNPGGGTDPGTPPTNPGGGTDPGTPPTNPGGGIDPGTPPTNPGGGIDPGTPPTNPGGGIDPGTPPTNPGGGTDPGTPPTNPGGGTDPGTPPTDPNTPSPVTPEQVENIQKIIEDPIPNNPEDIKKQIKELKQFLEMFEQLTPEEQAELLRVLGVELTKLQERLAELERTLVAMESKEPTTDGTTAGNDNVSTAGESVAKLPQTDGASTTAMFYAGFALMAMSAFFFIRRRKNA